MLHAVAPNLTRNSMSQGWPCCIEAGGYICLLFFLVTRQSGSIIGQMSCHRVPLLEIVYFVPKNTKRPKCSSMSSSKQASAQALCVRLAFSRDAECHPQGVLWMLCSLQVNIPKMLGLLALFAGLPDSGTWQCWGKKVILFPE